MIIGISGKAGSGKDTAAQMLKWIYNNPGKTWQDCCNTPINSRYADINVAHFADALKEATQHMLVVSDWETNTQEGKMTYIDWLGMTVREFLQKFGTAMRLNVDPNFWVKALWANLQSWDNVIIADVRYPNELQSIIDRGGFVIRLEREGAGAGNHDSETALDNYTEWDWYIENNGSLEDLYNKLAKFANSHPLK